MGHRLDHCGIEIRNSKNYATSRCGTEMYSESEKNLEGMSARSKRNRPLQCALGSSGMVHSGQQCGIQGTNTRDRSAQKCRQSVAEWLQPRPPSDSNFLTYRPRKEAGGNVSREGASGFLFCFSSV